MEIPEWKLRRILWHRCGGCIYLGVQCGLRPSDSIVLFDAPSQPGRTLAIPLTAFAQGEDIAVAIIRHKLFVCGLDFITRPPIPKDVALNAGLESGVSPAPEVNDEDFAQVV